MKLWTDASKSYLAVKDENGAAFVVSTCPNKRTINELEYLAIIEGLLYAYRCGEAGVALVTDSQVAERHINGTYKCKEPRLQALRACVLAVCKLFPNGVTVGWMRGEDNPADQPSRKGVANA